MRQSKRWFAICSFFICFFSVFVIKAEDILSFKLPFLDGQSFLVTQGYNEGTHTGKDGFALDFTQNGCDAYGKDLLSVADGKVKTVTYDKIYGNKVVIEHADNLESVYAHLKEAVVVKDQEVVQGELIGYVGNTGNSVGKSCPDHPGTHLHFVVYQEMKQESGAIKVLPYRPEPMSGYGKNQDNGEFIVGQWYQSNNHISENNNKTGGNLDEVLLTTNSDYGSNACGNNAKGAFSYSKDSWTYLPNAWQSNSSKTEDYFTKGFFSSADGKCKIDYYDGPMQGTFCNSGGDEGRRAACKEDVLTTNGNKLYRYFGEYEKNGKFAADYRFNVDDQKCCDGYGTCGYFFAFFLEAPSQVAGIECMAAFEELLKSFRMKDVESTKTEPPAKNKPVAEEPSVSNQPPSEAEINIAKSRGDITASITTNKGTIKLQLYGGKTPVTVANFVKLAQAGFYNGLKFHRVIKGFMIQGGDPLTKDDSKQKLWGTGGPGYKLNDEPFSGDYVRGTLAMGNSGPNTNGSQFFIMQKDYPLARSSVIFGKVTEGMDVVDAIANVKTDSSDHPLEPVVISDIKIN